MGDCRRDWVNLYIIRHGESTWNNQNRIQGSSDPGLSKLGRLQAGLLAGRFKKINPVRNIDFTHRQNKISNGVKIDKLYSSPLLRSVETAQVIANRLKLKIIRRNSLKEVGLGEWEDKTPDEIDRLYDNKFQKWLRFGPTKVKIRRAENITHFRKRVDKAFAAIVKENKDKENIIVVTHGGVISSFLSRLLDADFDKLILRLHLPNTSVTLVSFEKGRGYLIHIADTFHLSKVKDIWPT